MASQSQYDQSHARNLGEDEHHNGESSLGEKLKQRGTDFLRDKIEEFRDKSDDAKTIVSEYVKEKPIKALGIAVVTGMALALILRH